MFNSGSLLVYSPTIVIREERSKKHFRLVSYLDRSIGRRALLNCDNLVV